MSTLAFDRSRRRKALARPSLAALTARPELIVLLAIAGVLNLWALDLNGWANDYYAAAVRSMSTSWHAFLYGSYDVAGLQTVDKPPLALWVQALSARAFGFNSWSILVPQALMGVATVGLVYDLARSRFGRAAGTVAGLTLALTPITVAISRHNNPDALLVLCIVGGAVGAGPRPAARRLGEVADGGRRVRRARLRDQDGAPRCWSCRAWSPRGCGSRRKGRWSRPRQLLAGGAVMAAVGLAWPVLVWLTPAVSRPYVSGTDDNSIWSLILGYNGLGRLFGQAGGPGGAMGGGGGGVFGGAPAAAAA